MTETPGTKFVMGGVTTLLALLLAGLSTGLTSTGEIPPIMLILTGLVGAVGAFISLLAVGEYMDEMVRK